MRFSFFFALLALFLLASSPFARADDEDVIVEDGEHEETIEVVADEDSQVATTDLTFSHLFPEAPLGNHESGKFAHILIGITNNGDDEYTVHNLEASFRFNMNFDQVLQNFTTYRYGVSLKPGEQATLSYKWPIQALFEPAEFGFTVLVTYEDSDGIMYQSPGFNGTITVVDPIRTFDLETLSIFIFIGLFLAGVGYFVSQVLFDRKKTTRSAPREEKPVPETKEEKKEEKKNVDMSWIPEHNIKKSPKFQKK